MGLAAYLTYEVRRFKLMADTIPIDYISKPEVPSLTGDSYRYSYARNSQYYTDNILWVGAEVSKQQGKVLTYTQKDSLD